jgi:hypothetical protein
MIIKIKGLKPTEEEALRPLPPAPPLHKERGKRRGIL